MNEPTGALETVTPPSNLPHPDKHRGLIFLFSREETLRAAIQCHQPVLEHCWLLVTPQMQERAAQFASAFTGLDVTLCAIGDHYDANACYRTVRDVYRRKALRVGIPPEQVIADITGGTKPMTMGVVVACMEGGYPIEHVPTAFDAAGQASGPLPPIQIVIRGRGGHANGSV